MTFATDSSRALSRDIYLIRLGTVLALFCLWEVLRISGLFYAGVLPSTFAVVSAIASELADQSFYQDLGITMLETIAGFLFGSLIAIAAAISLGMSKYARKMVEPYIIAIGSTPKIIFLPILFLIFGLGVESKMAKAAMSAFFPVALSCTSGFVQIPGVLLRVGKSFELTRRQMIWKIYLPAMTNPLITGLRLGMAMAIIGVLAAEVAYSNAGLGFRLMRDADQFKIPSVYAVIILIFSISSTINFTISKVQDRFNRHDKRRGVNLIEIGAARVLGEN